jgi:tripartite-type tricarboxylate transporter receptor subunit TctC
MKTLLGRLARPVLIGLVIGHQVVSAAAEPAGPVKLIVPGTPGGAIDIRVRWLAQRLEPVLKVPVVVDYRPGASGNIGVEAGVRSVPDGKTIVVIHQGVMAINPHLYRDLRYDPLVDLKVITRVGVGPQVLAVGHDVPAHSVAELVQFTKARRGQTSFGSPGVGTPPHLAGELFKTMTGVDSLHVPYKGGAQVAADLIAGRVHWAIDNLGVLLPHIRAGRVRAIAVTGPARLRALPDTPSMTEAGLTQYEFLAWSGLAVPAATPAETVATLYAAIAPILQSSDARAWFAELGIDPGGEPPEVFAAFVRSEHARWGKVIRDAGVRIEQ